MPVQTRSKKTNMTATVVKIINGAVAKKKLPAYCKCGANGVEEIGDVPR